MNVHKGTVFIDDFKMYPGPPPPPGKKKDDGGDGDGDGDGDGGDAGPVDTNKK